ncbi:histidine kinase [Halorubrum sp. SP3]|uniref:histidine kinase N-terminal 7TM domain-containing protein n=1 Tax=unclassified Halorubrum TaxID=2642239 RepID=UPI0010F5C59D|nr:MULTISPECIES: histidine kinase N-terminal 7TM domain-containing protein [unclassified Halorubrum]TKX54320.1 histidine kinase [Halorubrum sp. SP3]TKX69145.1 histidine kinase [Halorubrum sp. SP9]
MVLWWVVSLFALSGGTCFAAAFRGSRLRNGDARRGLRALLILVGVWAFLQGGVLLAAEEPTAVALYTLALTVGFATPFAWCYFASAYAGRDYHRRTRYRRAAVALYVAVVGLKLTNPVHGRYFDAALRTEPARRLVVEEGALYWGSFALAYALSAGGFYLLYRLFRRSEGSTWTLAGVFAATGLAVVPNAVARAAPSVLPQLSYEPLGVAVFAVGSVYLVEDTFLAVEETATRSFVERTAGAVLILDTDGRVRDHNERATELFPSLADDADRIEELSPSIADEYRDERPTLIDVSDADGSDRTYCVTSEPLAVGGVEFGWALLVQDVTAIERQREQLDRHEEQLGDMAGAIAHELRNSVAVADGHLAEAADRLDGGEEAAAAESVAVARSRVARIGGVVEDLHTLVRYARDTDEPSFVEFEAAVTDAATASGADVDVVVEGDGQILAAPTRLKQLFKNAFEFAAFNDATAVTVSLTDDGFAVADDGRFTGDDGGSLLFEYESAEPSAEAGMALPNVRALGRVEGWALEPDLDYDEGVRYVLRGATVERDAST